MRQSSFVSVISTLLLAVVVAGCGQSQQEGSEAESETVGEPKPEVSTESGTAKETLSTVPVVEVIAREYAFESPGLLPSGWTTFRLKNEGDQTHFLLIYKLPQGKTKADITEEVVPVYDRVMEALQNGEMDKSQAMEALGNDLPEWFFNVRFRGGPGLVAPGKTAQATVNLSEPGLYLMECYVKGPGGRFHSSMGMSKQFRVTEGSIEASPPGIDVEAGLGTGGIEAPEMLEAGVHTVRVHFREDPPGGIPYDLHVVKLSADTDVEALKAWMDWMNVGGLRAPAPAEFVGGAENMSAGNTAYFTLDLEPGRYAWISEVGATGNMYREFTVE